MLKTFLYSVACLGLLTFRALTGPFDPSKVASDAKWIVHVDFDAFRNTQFGKHITEKVLEPKFQETQEKVKKLNLSINLQNINSITAYGPAFEKDGEGVLVLATSADIKKDLDTLVGMAALNGDGPKPFEMVQQNPFALYAFNHQVFLAPDIGKSVLVAKSRAQLERAREVILGKSENLTAAQKFQDYPELNKRAFFMAMAEGFNNTALIPPQAQVLRESRGGRLVLGETDKNLFMNLVFNAKNAEASTKIQQVLQGIVALISLSQQDKEITDLAGSAQIAAAGSMVKVDLSFPAEKAIEQFDKRHNSNPAHRTPRRVREKHARGEPAANEAPERSGE